MALIFLSDYQVTTKKKKVAVIKLYNIIYRVQSFTDHYKFYTVIMDKNDKLPKSCDCPAFEFGKQPSCKHMKRVIESIEFEDFVDESEKKEKLTTAVKNNNPSSWKSDKYDF